MKRQIRYILPLLALLAVIGLAVGQAYNPAPASAHRHSCPSGQKVVLDVSGQTEGRPILTEESQFNTTELNGANIRVLLCNLQYDSTVSIGHFVPSLTGHNELSVFQPEIRFSGANRVSNTEVTLVVSYNGVDFDHNTHLRVTVKAAALTTSSDVKSDSIYVIATNDPPGQVTGVTAEVVYPDPHQNPSILVKFPQLRDYVESYSIDLRRGTGNPVRWSNWQSVRGVTTNRCQYDYVNGEWVRNEARTHCANMTATFTRPFGYGVYQVRVIAIGAVPHGQNIGPPSSPVEVTGVDQAPGQTPNVRVTPGPGNDEFTVEWDHAERAASYKIQWTTEENFGSSFVERIVSGDDAHSAGYEGLASGERYRLRIISVSVFGRDGPPSEVVEFTTLATTGQQGEESNSGQDGNSGQPGEGQQGQPGQQGQSGQGGQSGQQGESAQTSDALTAPTNVAATVSGSSVTVTWTDGENAASHVIVLAPTADPTNYRVDAERSGNSATFRNVAPGQYIAIVIAMVDADNHQYAYDGPLTVQ